MNTKTVGLAMALSVATACGGGSTEPTTTDGTETTEATETTEGSETTETTEATTGEGSADEPQGVPGGWAGGDVDDEGPREAAAFAVQEQARRSGDTIQLVRIVSVSQQVVSGMNYRLGLAITRNGTAEQATAEVYSQPWTSTTQLTSWTSGPVR